MATRCRGSFAPAGWTSSGNEIWNGGRFTDYDKDGRFDEWEVLRWHDENRAGKNAQRLGRQM